MKRKPSQQDAAFAFLRMCIGVNLSKIEAKTALKYVTPPGFGGF